MKVEVEIPDGKYCYGCRFFTNDLLAGYICAYLKEELLDSETSSHMTYIKLKGCPNNVE